MSTINQLVCMRLKDMHVRRVDQDSSHKCMKCGAQVGIYPSGQQALKDHPGIVIICHVCLITSEDRNEFDERPAPGALEELFESHRWKNN